MLEHEWRDPADYAHYERHPIEDLEPCPASQFTLLSEVLSAVLVWATEKSKKDISGFAHRKGKSVRYFCASKTNLRIVAMVFAIRSDLVGTSLRDVARRIGCSPEGLRRHVKNFRETFHYQTPGQWKPESRARLAAAMKVKHWRRRNGATVENHTEP